MREGGTWVGEGTRVETSRPSLALRVPSVPTKAPSPGVAPPKPPPPSPAARERVKGSHVLDDRVPELRALQFRCSLHHPVEVVRHRLGGDRSVHPLDDQVAA